MFFSKELLPIETMNEPRLTRINRKEKGSFSVQKHMFNPSIITSRFIHGISPRFHEKRTSICASLRGSITIEASLVLPLFFLGLVCVAYLAEILALQMSVNIGMHYAMEQIVADMAEGNYLSDQEIEALVIEGIGEEVLDRSIVVDGKEGIDCSDSYISLVNGLVTLEVDYQVALPIPQFGSLGMGFQETMIGKGWTGYVSGISSASTSDEIVYITDNGAVYHVDYNCTHLQLNITSTTYGAVGEMRNTYGGTYSSCSFCIEDGTLWEDGDVVYIAANGDCYHGTLSCSGLTRTIYAVSLSDVLGKGVCSRCGQ